jgi:Reverse transcriptase (RNA-dependent DNA polymerase)
VFVRPNANPSTEGQRRNPGAFLVELFNRSLVQGIVTVAFRTAYTTPLLKKPDLDPANAKSDRPISNLSVLSKLLERLVAQQLPAYLTASKLLPELQSAYRAFHSTETATLKVLADILRAVDGGDLAMLTLLDMSAAFDTVDHATLLTRLRKSYDLGGSVHRWFKAYLDDRSQFVRSGIMSSSPALLLCGVPQGSVSDRFSYCCTLLTLFGSLNVIIFTRIFTLMTRKSTGFVGLMLLHHSSVVCQRVSRRLLRG